MPVAGGGGLEGWDKYHPLRTLGGGSFGQVVLVEVTYMYISYGTLALALEPCATFLGSCWDHLRQCGQNHH